MSQLESGIGFFWLLIGCWIVTRLWVCLGAELSFNYQNLHC